MHCNCLVYQNCLVAIKEHTLFHPPTVHQGCSVLPALPAVLWIAGGIIKSAALFVLTNVIFFTGQRFFLSKIYSLKC